MCSRGFVDPSGKVIEKGGKVENVDEGVKNQMTVPLCCATQQKDLLMYLDRSSRSKCVDGGVWASGTIFALTQAGLVRV